MHENLNISAAIISKFADIAQMAQKRAKNYFPSHGNLELV